MTWSYELFEFAELAGILLLYERVPLLEIVNGVPYVIFLVPGDVVQTAYMVFVDVDILVH